MTKTEIGNAITRARRAKGITQKQLADLAKDKRQNIVLLEAGSRNISLDRLQHVLTVLDMTITIS